MIKVVLERFAETGGATVGILRVPDAPAPLFTMEPPWRNNEPFVSCLPVGSYVCELRFSKKFQRNTYFVLEDFPQRDAIEFHRGAWPEDTKGCIMAALGLVLPANTFEKPKLVNSGAGFSLFMRLLKGDKRFSLEITDLKDML